MDASKGDFFSRSVSWLCFLFEKDTFFLKRKKKTFHFSITPSFFTSPILPRSSFQGEEKKRRDAFHLHGSSPPSHSFPIIPATTFMHETEKKIESIHWPFRQWRKEILRALLDMKIYNKNQFLASLCSLNDKASTHSAIVCRKVILQHRQRQERRILSDLRLQILIWYRPTEIIGGT